MLAAATTAGANAHGGGSQQASSAWGGWAQRGAGSHGVGEGSPASMWSAPLLEELDLDQLLASGSRSLSHGGGSECTGSSSTATGVRSPCGSIIGGLVA